MNNDAVYWAVTRTVRLGAVSRDVRRAVYWAVVDAVEFALWRDVDSAVSFAVGDAVRGATRD